MTARSSASAAGRPMFGNSRSPPYRSRPGACRTAMLAFPGPNPPSRVAHLSQADQLRRRCLAQQQPRDRQVDPSRWLTADEDAELCAAVAPDGSDVWKRQDAKRAQVPSGIPSSLFAYYERSGRTTRLDHPYGHVVNIGHVVNPHPSRSLDLSAADSHGQVVTGPVPP